MNDLLCAASNQELVLTEDERPAKKQKRKEHGGVVLGRHKYHIPTTCPVRMIQRNGVVIPKGDPSKRVRRKIVNCKETKRFVCERKKCLGITK